MDDFKKASEDDEISRVIDRNTRIMNECYENVKAMLGREPKDNEPAYVNTLFIQSYKDIRGSSDVKKENLSTEKGSISKGQKKYIRDLANRGDLPERVLEDLDNYSKKKASDLIDRGKRGSKDGDNK